MNTKKAIVLGFLLTLFFPFASIVAAGGGFDVRVTQVDKSKFPRIDAFIFVSDENGQGIRGLTEEQLRISEGRTADIPKEIAHGSGVKTPLSVALVLDHSGSMQRDIGAAKMAARTFVSLLAPDDRACLVGFAERARLIHEISSDKGALTSGLERIVPGGGTAFYDAVSVGVDQVKDYSGRRAVLALTDGIDNQSSSSLPLAIAYTVESNVSVYAIGLGGQVRREALRRLSEETGGRALFAPSSDELKNLYERIGQEIRNEFRVSYISPRPVADGTRRKVTVTISRGGVEKASSGIYLAGGVIGGTQVTSTSQSPQSKRNYLFLLSPVLATVMLLFLPKMWQLVKNKDRSL